MSRVWDQFLTSNDKEHIKATPGPRSIGFGLNPALLRVDNYRSVVGNSYFRF